jgi:8-oxo-dGTP diphosphatase
MSAGAGRGVTEVAVGVLVRADGAVLLADRPPGKPYAGYWEFPGGKIEPGETVATALARELREELGITIGPSTPWVTFEFDYPHAYVRLHFERVFGWTGDPHAREGQRIGFYRLDQPAPAPLLPAAVPALRWLALPDVLHLAGNATELGRVLTVQELRAASARPPQQWAGTFAAERADLARAASLQFDFALAGPVRASQAGDGVNAVGWERFAAHARGTPLPLYAFGGLTRNDLAEARRHGAHGIAVSAPAG